MGHLLAIVQFHPYFVYLFPERFFNPIRRITKFFHQLMYWNAHVWISFCPHLDMKVNALLTDNNLSYKFRLFTWFKFSCAVKTKKTFLTTYTFFIVRWWLYISSAERKLVRVFNIELPVFFKPYTKFLFLSLLPPTPQSPLLILPTGRILSYSSLFILNYPYRENYKFGRRRWNRTIDRQDL